MERTWTSRLQYPTVEALLKQRWRTAVLAVGHEAEAETKLFLTSGWGIPRSELSVKFWVQFWLVVQQLIRKTKDSTKAHIDPL